MAELMNTEKPSRTVSLRLTISAAAMAAALAGGASAAVHQVRDQVHHQELTDQVAELREDRAANRVRFEEICRRLESIESSVKAIERRQ